MKNRELFPRYLLRQVLSSEKSTWKTWLAMDIPNDRQVIVKELAIPKCLYTNKRELLIACDRYLSLCHPNLARPIDIFLASQSPPRIHVVYEFIDAEDFLDSVKSVTSDNFIDLIGQFCSVLHYIHTRQYVHLDLHPGNLLLIAPRSRGDRWQLKLIDLPFAPLSTLLDNRDLYTFHPTYSSPEVRCGAAIDHRADLYSLGAILYSASLHEPPPELMPSRDNPVDSTGSPSRLDSVSPEFLAPIIRKLLQYDPDRRFASAHFVLRELNANLKSKKIPIDPVPLPEETLQVCALVPTTVLHNALDRIDRYLSHPTPQVNTLTFLGAAGAGKTRLLKAVALYCRLSGALELIKHGARKPGHFCLITSGQERIVPTTFLSNFRFFLISADVDDRFTNTILRFRNLRLKSGLIILCAKEALAPKAGPELGSLSQQININSMDHTASCSLLNLILLPNTISEQAKEHLIESCLGLPGALTKEITHLVHTGVIRRHGGFWHIEDRDISSLHLSLPTKSILGSSLMRLEPLSRRILELLGLVSFGLNMTWVPNLFGVPLSLLESSIQELLLSRFIRRKDSHIDFPTLAIREFVRSRGDSSAGTGSAIQYLQALRRFVADRPTEIDAIIAEIAMSAHSDTEAYDHALKACQYYDMQQRPKDALHFCEIALRTRLTSSTSFRLAIIQKALELLARIGDQREFRRHALSIESALPSVAVEQKLELEILLARHYATAGDFRLSLRRSRSALNIAAHTHNPEKQAAALDILADVFLRTGRTGRALRTARQAIITWMKASRKDLTASAINTMAGAYYFEGKYDKALRCAKWTLRTQRRTKPSSRQAVAQVNTAILHMESGNMREADRCYHKALTIAQLTQDYYAAYLAHSNLAMHHRYLGNFAQSAAFGRKALDLASLSGTAYGIHNCFLTLADAFHHRGAFDTAIVFVDKAYETARGASDHRGRALSELQRAFLLYSLGRFTDAGEMLQRLATEFRKTAYRVHELLCHLGSADLYLALGQTDEARHSIDRAHTIVPKQHTMSYLAYNICLARYHESTLNKGQAERALTRAVHLARNSQYLQYLFEAWLHLAQNQIAAGRIEDAGVQLNRLVTLNQRLKYRLHEPWLHRALADHAGALGDGEEQKRHLLNAKTCLLELSYNIGDPDLRQSFLNRPDSRALLIQTENIEDILYDGHRGQAESPQAARALESIARINQHLHRRDSLKSTLSLIADEAIRLSGAERGIIFLFDPSGREELKVARNLRPRSLMDARRYTRTALRRIRSGEIVYAADTFVDPSFVGVESITHLKIRSVACVPLRSRSSIIGALYLDSRRPGMVSSAELLKSLEIFAQQAGSALERAIHYFHLAEENMKLKQAATIGVPQLVGQGSYFSGLKKMISAAANSDLPVLILGESGTGKELVARAIHFSGRRSTEPFLSVDCGALPENLVQSELFGYEKGAFTGADRDKEGLFIAARGGTIFLDEIGNTSPSLQAKLLRAIQEREVRPVGATRSVPFQARLVTATNRDLRREARENRFRPDLLFRLNGLTLELPALRDRKTEIPALVAHFLQKLANRYSSRVNRVSDEALQALLRHDWPGNIRELENCIERAVALAPDGTIDLKSLPDNVRSAAMVGWSGKKGEHRLIEEALSRFNGDKTRAADYIGWNRQKLYRKMTQYNIPQDFGRRNTA